MKIDELRARLEPGKSVAVTKLSISDDGEVLEVEMENCVDEHFAWDGRFLRVVPNPEKAFQSCILRGMPTLKRSDDGSIDMGKVSAARALFGLHQSTDAPLTAHSFAQFVPSK